MWVEVGSSIERVLEVLEGDEGSMVSRGRTKRRKGHDWRVLYCGTVTKIGDEAGRVAKRKRECLFVPNRSCQEMSLTDLAWLDWLGTHCASAKQLPLGLFLATLGTLSGQHR